MVKRSNLFKINLGLRVSSQIILQSACANILESAFELRPLEFKSWRVFQEAFEVISWI